MKDFVLEYAGDDGSRIVSWFKKHLAAIECCANAGFPEAALVLIYSGIDTLGLLNACAETNDATRDTFKDWCNKYLVERLSDVDVNPVTATDLYAARCGVLHTSTAISKLSREGNAREVWYQFRGRTGVNLLANVAAPPLRLDIERLAIALTQAGCAFIRDLIRDQASLQAADVRAQHFLRWGTVVPT